MNFKKIIMPKNIISQGKLKKILNYDPETGIFHWKVDRKNGTKNKSRAGTLRNNTKLIYISIEKTRYRADKLAFLYMTGEYPKQEITHKNNIRFLNNWNNLKLQTVPEIKNYNKGGNQIRGVVRDEKYKTIIFHNGKRCFLGNTKDFDEAVCLRYAGEQACFGNVQSPARTYVEQNIQRGK